MTVDVVVGIVREYFLLALVGVVVLGVVFFLALFLLNRKFPGLRDRLSKKKLLLIGLFTGYVLMVIGVTFIDRGHGYHNSIELSLFASYLEAWYSPSVRKWQFLYFNILMFVPFGVLFPLLHPRFRKARWTLGIAALFTLSIETLQLVTGFGIFDVDDLFNNLLGAVIGYGLLMGLIALKARTAKRAFLYFSPLLVVALLSGSLLAYYHLKEFGNLDIVAIHKADMANAKLTVDVKLSENKQTVPVYRAPNYTKEEAEEFAVDFFRRMNVDPSRLEVHAYSGSANFFIEKYRLWFEYIDGSYKFADFSLYDDGKNLMDTSAENLKEQLLNFGVEIPDDAQMEKVQTGIYTWTADKIKKGNKLIDGKLTVNYYNDDTLKGIDNKIVVYEKVRDVEIKSEQEAYEEILDGKFIYYSADNKLKSLHIKNIELSYYLDSKGFYQPVYAFHSMVDGRESTILIPGI